MYSYIAQCAPVKSSMPLATRALPPSTCMARECKHEGQCTQAAVRTCGQCTHEVILPKVQGGLSHSVDEWVNVGAVQTEPWATLQGWCTAHINQASMGVCTFECRRQMHTYSFPALCCALTKRVARSTHTIRLPVTLGSKVPLWPVFSTRSMRLIHATTS